jgi:hypothetical protein
MAKTVKRKKVKKVVKEGKAFIKSTFNNTLVTFTDDNGNAQPTGTSVTAGNKITLSDDAPFPEYLAALDSVPGLRKAVEAHFAPASPEELAVGMELVLEGLTQHLKIAREDLDSRVSYTEMLKFNLVKSRTS